MRDGSGIMKARKDGEATREAILEAAFLVFGEKGFHKATHAEICSRADVNTALINFHFGSKEGLYRAVWERAAEDIERRYPIEGGVPPDAPAHLRLRGHINSLLNRALDPRLEGFHRLRTMESISPTGMLDEAFIRRKQEYRSQMRDILAELLGPAATDETVDLCEMSVISQCRILRSPHHRKSRARLRRFGHEDVGVLTEHITRFSLAGIRAVRREIEDAG